MIQQQKIPENWSALQERAIAGLERNCRPVYGSGNASVLNEGGIYTGIWLESGPYESTVVADLFPEVALASHRIFYRHQRPDGQFPAYILRDRAGYSQIQQVTPIARTAWDLARRFGDEAFLRESYDACCRWEAWLIRYRDPRGLDLLEAWCEYDSGHDNSPRWRGYPQCCPEEEAHNRPLHTPGPLLAPDLSATLYGIRIALAEMAEALGLTDAAEHYIESGHRTREAIERYCYDPETEFYYDALPDGSQVKIIGDAGLRVLGELVPDQKRADRIFQRHILNPAEFWTPYPLPSIAADDPAFIYPAPLNCWGGGVQALTALRAPYWFEAYGYHAELIHLACRWLDALSRTNEFMQQMDPFTGEFSTSPGYTPSMCIAVDFLHRCFADEMEHISMVG